MSVKEQTVTEMQRRVALLPRELDEWQALVKDKVEDLGIHTSQFETIDDFFDERIELHTQQIQELEGSPDDRELAHRRWQLEAELAGAHGLMMVFRNIMAQRFDTDRYNRALEAADLVAADCYRPCVQLAVNWRVLKKGQYRVPPLTFLNARSSPQALTRGKTFKAFGFDLEGREKALRLPFGFVSLRYHDTRAFWSYCSIHHEVGHLLDYDLGLESELRRRLEGAPVPDVDAGRIPWWAGWLREAIADALGMLLGGAGFALALSDILFRPASEVLQSPAGGDHPPPYLRIFLLGELLRCTGVPELATLAGEIEAGWQAIYGENPPAPQAPYLKDCRAMSRFLLNTHLMDTLDNRPLRDLVPYLAQDHAKAVTLSQHLRGLGSAPNPATYPMRLAPAAARLALREVKDGHEAAYADIHQRALCYALSIPHDPIMGPGELEKEQKEYLRELARSVRFSEMA